MYNIVLKRPVKFINIQGFLLILTVTVKLKWLSTNLSKSWNELIIKIFLKNQTIITSLFNYFNNMDNYK